jgi:hypothetical protein
MSRPPLPPEVRALLDREREVPPLPAAVRARLVARARAAVAAGAVRDPAAPRTAPRVRWAAAAALVLLASAAGAAAYGLRARFAAMPSRPPAVVVPAAVVAPPAPAASPAPAATPAPAEQPAPHAAEAPRLSPADAARAELRLLRQARAAVARQDFAAALAPIAEHARRFKDGRLAEEREALRVKSLAGLGRTDEARRAAAAFEARFPRSVLLPAVSQMPASEP